MQAVIFAAALRVAARVPTPPRRVPMPRSRDRTSGMITGRPASLLRSASRLRGDDAPTCTRMTEQLDRDAGEHFRRANSREDDAVPQGCSDDGVGLQAAALSGRRNRRPSSSPRKWHPSLSDLATSRHPCASGIHRFRDLPLLVIPAQAGIHTPRPPAKPRMNGSLPCSGAASRATRLPCRVQSSPAAPSVNHCATRARASAGSTAWWLNSLVPGEYA